jgi:preprotein translocase subunit SecB
MMAEQGNGENGPGGAAGADTQIPIRAKIVSQYVKDLSFENPSVSKLISGPGDPPNLQVEVNVGAQRIDKDIYESFIDFKATATNNLGTIYILETVYAGLLKIESIPDAALEPFLLISGPTMLFPFLRRLVADVTREGGFPPLLLEPIDFAGLYTRRQQQPTEVASKTDA